MKKWQEWTIVAVAIVVVVGAIGGAYWYLTKDTGEVDSTTEVIQTQEQKDLADVDADLNAVDDLDLTALDTIEKDLASIDLSELE